MQAILIKDECSGRVLQEFISDRNFGKYMGVIFNNGESWKEMRRFTIRTLRDFGFGKKDSMESVMKDELDHLIELMKEEMSQRDGKVKVELLFNLSLLNVLWTMVAGKRFNHDDPRLQFLLDLNEKAFKAGTFGADLSIAFPFLRHLFPGPTGANILQQLFREFHQYFGVSVQR
jgi:methyl farnesoate epoxidase/farnesoate epoxidase